MDKDKFKENVLAQFHEGLDTRRGFQAGESLRLQFSHGMIVVLMFDSRLKEGKNTRQVFVSNEITDNPFVTAKEKTISVNNYLIKGVYEFREPPLNEPMYPTMEQVILRIKNELPLMADTLIAQVIKNNDFLYPTYKQLKGETA